VCIPVWVVLLWGSFQKLPLGCPLEVSGNHPCLVPPHRQVPSGFSSFSFIGPSKFERPLPFGIHSSPDEIKFCYLVTPNSIKKRVCFERVELVDPSDLPCHPFCSPCPRTKCLGYDHYISLILHYWWVMSFDPCWPNTWNQEVDATFAHNVGSFY